MLERPARYFPLEKGLYEVAPGLRILGTPFGNGPRDSYVFQLDSNFPKYRTNKLECRKESLNKYYLTSRYSPEVASRVARFLAETFAKEHPHQFRYEILRDQSSSLVCELTQETLYFDPQMNLSSVARANPITPEYQDAFDALASQVQSDVAITCRDRSENWLAAIHLCSPAHWSAAEKIGKDFTQIHQPVAGIEKVNRAAPGLVDAMITKGPYIRFVWGFATDDRLNHHPTPPPGVSPSEWKGRTFEKDRTGSPFILRLERQVTYGLPEINASVFSIHTFFIEGNEIRANEKERALLRAGLLSMTGESREYKGIAQCFDDVIQWLG